MDTENQVSQTSNYQPQLSMQMAVLWFLLSYCCGLPTEIIGRLQMGQLIKGIVIYIVNFTVILNVVLWGWLLIFPLIFLMLPVVTLVDYWMCFSVHQKRELKEWEFFPTK